MGKHERQKALDEYEARRRLPLPMRSVVDWVRLCRDQGTRLVDVLDSWKDEAKRANDIAERHAVAMERLANTLAGQEDNDDG